MTKIAQMTCGVLLAALIGSTPAFGLQNAQKPQKPKKPKKAQKELKASSAVTDTAVTQALAQLAAWQNQAARETLEGAKATLGTTPEYQTAWALLEFQEGNGTDATLAKKGFDTLNQAARKQNSDPMTLYYQGEVLYLQQKNNEAAAAWQTAAERAAKVVAKDEQNAVAQFYLGAALVRQKNFNEAMTALRAAEALGFPKAMVKYQIGFIYLFQQKWQEAKDAFDLGLEADPRYAPMYFWRGMAWDKLGRKDNMLLDLDQYVKLAPNGPEAGKARAILKSAGG